MTVRSIPRVVLACYAAVCLLAAPARASLSAAPSSFCDSVVEIPRSECEALVALYDQTSGQRWLWTTGWLETPTPCTWFGMSCAGGHVTEMLLTSNWLQGAIPSQLGDLPRLTTLDLAYNRLQGGIPPELGALANLRWLSLSDNQLGGSIPPELADLAALERLYLHSNRLSGAIPSELGHLRGLEYLALYNNQLDGPIPPELGNLTKLFDLDLSSNHLAGGLPANLGELKRLERLSLQNNRLSGALDPRISGMTNLLKLRIENNALSGDIPSTIATMTRLGPRPFDTDLGYNMLASKDPAVQQFLATRDPDWAETQTVPPESLRGRFVAAGSLEISWPAVAYAEHAGRHEIGSSDQPTGAFTILGATADKASTQYVVNGVAPFQKRCFAVRTFTPAHGPQQNALTSAFSEPLCVPLASLFCPRVGTGDSR